VRLRQDYVQSRNLGLRIAKWRALTCLTESRRSQLNGQYETVHQQRDHQGNGKPFAGKLSRFRILARESLYRMESIPVPRSACARC
jgi:hypothetical protein